MREGDCAGALPAASLLLVERSGRRVLMGRRPEASRFMPGVYVFPGGTVESADRSVTACRRLPDRHARLVVAEDDIDADTLAVTAIRETFEETRILCAGGYPGCPTDWPRLLAEGWRPDLGRLSYLGRALTPPGHRKRFHARFFFTFTESDALPVTATPELEDLRWVETGATGDLPIAPVTRFMLGELRRRLGDQAEPRRTPFYYWRGALEQVDYDFPPRHPADGLPRTR